MKIANKVAIYVRVSTTSQAEEGYSIDEQKDKLSSYCHIKDWNIYNIYTDGGFSGSNTKRPALEKLIKDAKNKKFDTVLVYKLDRLSRSQKDTLYLIEDIFLENNIDFVSLLENFDTSTPFGKAMVGVLSVFAQLEREQIKERMQLGKIGRAKTGKSMMWAKTSYGYDYHKETGTVTVNPWQSIIIADIFDWYLSGKSITKIRDALNDMYGEDNGGKVWNYRAIRVILSNPVYCGYNQYKGQVFPGNHEPIISEEVFNKTQEELKIRQRKAAEYSNPRPFQAKYMLSGIAQCGYCQAPLKIIMGVIRKDGTRFIRYECHQRHPRKTKGVTVYNNNEKCHSGAYEKEKIEQYVLEEISKLQNDTKYLDDLFSNPETETIDRGNYQKQIDELTKKLSRLNDLYIDDRITLEELQKKSAEFTTIRAFLEAELENDPSLKQQERKEDMRKILSAGDIFSMDYEGQKVMVRGLINKVQVTAENIKIQFKV
ncbi:recombinase family protein [Streptococcus ruminantium]|uniref:recombinase family protein n=1 Tax=Streptococcus ruminantium TaxID=1917441 RepID=UPI0012DD7FC2|nr:recombinase family protein [Streptococcus ruminantium]